jgi:lauroyl/myristoyl acyltransferase
MSNVSEVNVMPSEPRHGKGEPTPLVVKSDPVTATALISCAGLACLPDRTTQTALCRSIAKKHIGLRGSRAETLRTIIPLLDQQNSADALEILLLADEYEAVAETWRDYMPWNRPLVARLIGGEHIDAALAAGRGAVLWSCTSGPGSRAALRCLANVGHKLVSLRDHAHPFSNSRFCRTMMNPIPNHVDNRYLDSVVIADEDNTVLAMEALAKHLAANRVVLVAANGAFGKPHEIPFFGGTLSLDLGAPALAMRGTAPLIPLFCRPVETGGYELIAEPPLITGLENPSQEARTAAVSHLADQYAATLERHLKHQPRIWESWFAEETWRPDPPAL